MFSLLNVVMVYLIVNSNSYLQQAGIYICGAADVNMNDIPPFPGQGTLENWP